MGSFGAVVGATIEDTDEDLAINGPLLVPGHRGAGRHRRRRTPHLRRRPRPGAALQLAGDPGGRPGRGGPARTPSAARSTRSPRSGRPADAAPHGSPAPCSPSPCSLRWRAAARTASTTTAATCASTARRWPRWSSPTSPSALLSHLPMLHDLAEQAPEDLDGRVAGLPRGARRPRPGDQGRRGEAVGLRGRQAAGRAERRRTQGDRRRRRARSRPKRSSRRPPGSSSRDVTSARSTSASDPP